MALKVQMSQSMAVLASLPSPSISSNRRSTRLPVEGLRTALKCRRQRAGFVRASGMAEPESAGSGGSGLVDSNMMVLRKRIQSIRMHESCYDTPADWAEWERSAYAGYRADICLLLSTMQSQLLTMRPGTALSIVSVLMAVLPVMSILFFIGTWDAALVITLCVVGAGRSTSSMKLVILHSETAGLSIDWLVYIKTPSFSMYLHHFLLSASWS